MTAPRHTATILQEQDTTKFRQSPQTPPGRPYNGPKDESLFVSDGESEHDSEHDSEDWSCICGDGLNTEGRWIRCDKSNCQLAWYHLACVGLEEVPAGKWICPQCRARTRKIAVARPDPEKKGIAIRVPRNKDQGHWKGWRELPSDEEEEFKRKVESSWEVQILPGKTRAGAGPDALYSEDKSESNENGELPNNQPQTDRPKQKAGKMAFSGPPHDEYPRLSPQQSGSNTDGQNVSKSEWTISAKNMEIATGIDPTSELGEPSGHDDSGAAVGVHAASEHGEFTEPERSDLAVNADMTVDHGDNSGSSTNDPAASSPEETPGDIMDVDEIARDIAESTLESDLAFNDPPVRSSRLTTPEAASILLSIASTTTGEAHRPRDSGPVILTEGDQALVAALRGTWVGRHFA